MKKVKFQNKVYDIKSIDAMNHCVWIETESHGNVGLSLFKLDVVE